MTDPDFILDITKALNEINAIIIANKIIAPDILISFRDALIDTRWKTENHQPFDKEFMKKWLPHVGVIHRVFEEHPLHEKLSAIHREIKERT